MVASVYLSNHLTFEHNPATMSHGKYIGENIKHDHEEVSPLHTQFPMVGFVGDSLPSISSRSIMTITKRPSAMPTNNKK